MVLRRLHGGCHDDVAVCDGLLYAIFNDDDDDSDDDGSIVIHVYSIPMLQRTSVIDISCAGRSHWHTLCVNANGMFVSCDFTDSVIKMSLDGKQITTYDGKKGNDIGEFDEPNACMSDKYGNMLIADSFNDRLQLLHGEQWFVLQLEPPLSRPCRAVYDSSALFVATWNPLAIVKYDEIE